jgi:hypothetical protein
MSERARRIAHNEQRFRVFNDEVRAVRAELHAESVFACECGDSGCTEPMTMSVEDYQHVRQDPRWFAVLPGHVRTDVERVLERRPTHLIVQKIGEGAEIVRSRDADR